MSRSVLVSRLAVAVLTVTLLAPLVAAAQELEPRAYANTPVGMNFLIAGYGHTHGDVAFDASVPIEDARLTVHGAFLAYARAIDVWGRAGKLDVVLPYAWLSGNALVNGELQERDVSGFADPRARFSVLLYGGPALTMAEFANYQQDFVVGASLAVTIPVGQYDGSKLVNIGTHRWSVKPEIGVSKTLGPWTVELDGSVAFFTTNHDFFGGRTLSRDPLFALQGHAIYHTRLGLWAALDATYYVGGRTIVDDKPGERQESVRVGATIAIPIDRHQSIKLYGSIGALARAGGSFDTAGIAWQFRWGGGL
jgi:hypothetical protein